MNPDTMEQIPCSGANFLPDGQQITEPEVSLPFSQDPTNSPCAETDESSTKLPTLFL
jgi:hypothetical protein